MVLILHLIGGEGGASFPHQSQSEVQKNQCGPASSPPPNWNFSKYITQSFSKYAFASNCFWNDQSVDLKNSSGW